MGHKRTSGKQESFVEIVEAVAAADPGPQGEPVELVRPLKSGEYSDDLGVRWRRRGDQLPWKRVQHLLRDPQVQVLHIDFDDVRLVDAEQREEFLAMIRPYLKGGSLPESAGASDFRAGEFKDSGHRSMLIVEEYC